MPQSARNSNPQAIARTLCYSRTSRVIETWANETQPFAFEDVEACLAHLTGNAVSRAYDRAEKIGKRAMILETWGSFVTGASASNVVPFDAQARP